MKELVNFLSLKDYPIPRIAACAFEREGAEEGEFLEVSGGGGFGGFGEGDVFFGVHAALEKAEGKMKKLWQARIHVLGEGGQARRLSYLMRSELVGYGQDLRGCVGQPRRSPHPQDGCR